VLGSTVGFRGFQGCTLCEKRLRLSWKVDECQALPSRLAHVPRLDVRAAVHARQRLGQAHQRLQLAHRDVAA